MIAALLALALSAQDPPAPQAQGDAYRDPGAAALVASARAQRERNERLVTAYTATATQRVGVGLRALRRDRMLFGQELVARIAWRRDGPSRVDVVGARERIPIARRGDSIPDDLEDSVEWMVLDPAQDYLRFFGDQSDGFIHPLAADAEAHYRYASGDTTSITLPDGRTLRLLELVIIPRRAEFRLMNGSLWFDADTYGMVRAVFAPARPFDIELDEPEDAEDVPGFVKPIRAEVKYVTIEYGLYSYRWWMLRYIAFDAEAQASVMRVPIRFERTYEGYQVEGGSEPVAGARRPAGSIRRDPDTTLTRAQRDSIGELIEACVERKAEEERQRRREAGERQVEVRVGGARTWRECRTEVRGIPDDRWEIEVALPADTQSLLTSPELGEPILQIGDVISESELRELARDIGAIPPMRMQAQALLPSGIWGSLIRNSRYNRVEAFSTGLNGVFRSGHYEVDGLARIGIADLEPNVELGITRRTPSYAVRLGGYRRLETANPDTRPFGVINSLSALLLQRDDGEYFRTLGGELTLVPDAGNAWKARLYWEQQRPADVETQASLPHLFDKDQVFRPNIVADTADQGGLALDVKLNRPLGGTGTLGADVQSVGEMGTFDFWKGALTLRATSAAGPLAVAVEGAAGTSTGGLPVQSLFYVGGPGTLRGYDGGAMAGESYWRGRLELGTREPAVRFVVFSDVAWAGDRTSFTTGQPFLGLGGGVAFLDGLFRLDLARAMRGPTGWRFDFYVDGLF